MVKREQEQQVQTGGIMPTLEERREEHRRLNEKPQYNNYVDYGTDWGRFFWCDEELIYIECVGNPECGFGQLRDALGCEIIRNCNTKARGILNDERLLWARSQEKRRFENDFPRFLRWLGLAKMKYQNIPRLDKYKCFYYHEYRWPRRTADLQAVRRVGRIIRIIKLLLLIAAIVVLYRIFW
jgi:hypothetical protein